ncbi:MAG: hypothetical protein A3J83_04975 [Elusimicrobia bacterium RIFOXYA2_FULL_40_6]|nr:MAG: hypothetical protein A3J83_04975 [Elusimicrobia bacterium RIFOXYA2_FULL_40_6]
MHEEKIPTMAELNLEEINAVLTHKWFLSEKACRDVGMEFAKNDFFMKHSRKWRELKIKEEVAAQKNEIVIHKWYLSEKLGYDVGTQEAALDWIKCGYAQHWRNCSGPYKNRAVNKFCQEMDSR